MTQGQSENQICISIRSRVYEKYYEIKESKTNLIFGLYYLQAVSETTEQFLQILSYSLKNIYIFSFIPFFFLHLSNYVVNNLSSIIPRPLSQHGYRQVLLEIAQIVSGNMAKFSPKSFYFVFIFFMTMIAIGQQLFNVQADPLLSFGKL